MGILIYLVLGWTVMFIYRRFLSTRHRKLRRQLKHIRNHTRDRLRWDADILPEDQQATMQEIQAKAADLRQTEPSVEQLEDFVKHAGAELGRIYPKKPSDTPHEIIELLVVVFGIVMGIRALFLQPFKIPTGSMQPTLYGIHFENTPQQTEPRSAVKRPLDFLNFAARHVYHEVEEDAVISVDNWADSVRVGSALPITISPFPVLQYTMVRLGSRTYRFPGNAEAVARRILHLDQGDGTRVFRTGDVISGHLKLGDHLFVDRLSYNFIDPGRGDIVVFTTDGIRYREGDSLSGLHYIKRLVGMPGETLQIRDRKLYVRQAGSEEFVLVDGSMDKAFDRIYSMQGGYHGYTNADGPRAQYLTTEDETFTLGPDEYFMLGDNTENSADSRYWGVVPRRNIIGRAFWVWWPFSRRWGLADRAEPMPDAEYRRIHEIPQAQLTDEPLPDSEAEPGLPEAQPEVAPDGP